MSEVHILDEIVLWPGDIATVLQLLEDQYLPGLPSRHTLALSRRWVSPPVQLEGQSNTLWLLWEVTDATGYYTMRGTAGLEVPAFWATVDSLCLQRRRHVMADAGQPLPKPLEAP
ncbi:MAG: hypothetical protein RJQ10_01220 [Haliea sp.]|uniref:hypothetical protein n=1 Tax=Haliea sp. TaxID=1932666 RepID=UPI0032EB06EC